MSTLTENAQIINQELNWLQTIIDHRINNFINQNNPNFQEQDPNPRPGYQPVINLLLFI